VSERSFFLDRGVGESRGVVLIGARPERLLIARDNDPAVQALGALAVARVVSVDRNLGLAFLDLGEGPEAILNLKSEFGPVGEGAFIEIEIRSEARIGKGASVRWLRSAEGPVRLLTPGPDLESRMRALAKSAAVESGPHARAIVDAAQDEALETVFPLPGGGDIAVQPTRALVAVDVDVGARSRGGKRVDRSANLAAIFEAARVLRLKGLGGLVVVDLAGRGHDGAALLAAARSAFAADNPGVAIGPVSRFGTLELTIPRRGRPSLEILAGGGPHLTDESRAMALLRAIEREATADRGARLEATAAPGIVDAAAPYLGELVARYGARLTLRAEAGRSGFGVEVR